MKKLFILALAAVMMAGCDTVETNIPLEKTDIKIAGWSGYIFKIDSCEYIRIGYGVTHKGNCKFCEHRRQKELEELVKKLRFKQ